MIEVFKFKKPFSESEKYDTISGVYLHGKAVKEIGDGHDMMYLFRKEVASEIQRNGNKIYDLLYGRKKGKLYFWKTRILLRGLIILDSDTDEIKEFAKEKFRNRDWLL